MADTAAAASTSAAPAPPAVVTRRIHLSGLAPAIPDAALLARFAALQPAGLHRPSAPNAVGAVPAVAWLTLTAPPKDIDRALGALHGSVWKGSKIRCGNAKHDGAKGPLPHKPESEAVRLRREEKEARRLKKASREKGCERPVDEAQVKAGEWGWHLTPAQHLVRPLHMRPDHPLPKPSTPAPPLRTGAVRPTPPTRARRTTLDPRRYGAKHLAGAILGNKEGSREWRLEETEEEDDASAPRWVDQDGAVEPVPKKRRVTPPPMPAIRAAPALPPAQPAAPKKQAVPEVEEASSSSSSDSEDSQSFLAHEDDADSIPDALFSPRRDDSPLFDDADAPGSPLFDDAEAPGSPLFDPRSPSPEFVPQFPRYDPREDEEWSEGYNEDAAAAAAASSAAPALKGDDEAQRMKSILGQVMGGKVPFASGSRADETVLDSDDDSELEELLRSSRPGAKGKAPAPKKAAEPASASSHGSSATIVEAAPVAAQPAPSAQDVVSESDEDEEEDEENKAAEPQPAGTNAGPQAATTSIEELQVEQAAVELAAPVITAGQRRRDMLLQPAAAAQEASASRFAPVVRFDPGAAAEWDDEDEEMEEPEPQPQESAAQPQAHGEAGEQKSAVMTQKLTDMFKPQEEAAGFSLLGNLDDLELDFDMEFETSELPEEPVTAAAPSAPAPAPVPGAVPGFDPSTSLPFFFPSFTRDRGEREPMALLLDGVPPFGRTETAEQIHARWEERRGTLTQEWKRRHREAVKKKKRGIVGSRRAGDAMPSR